ncbi:hypothetical protein Q5X71_04930 [Acinetobacter baumannii]|uniref:hypothetical protein n=1 Tax=Acinetobacter baumannii TaxID=470 RepID=UPI00112B665D|nr:hypothetical protein [Acinetobacter baumannii]MBP4343127.1 hypothetical protein [Acinetobacter baumannii]MBP4578816.1 hypothetical protein [Acinetobacter baumannii]MBP4847448.1 hypothetical protein [Acinetobacter baumannii]MDO7457371.1 hypothetical protein [Acinetobacter baumannii]TPT71673.1 hypothetical protein FJU58_16410 [Acinetobacter baumannii]
MTNQHYFLHSCYYVQAQLELGILQSAEFFYFNNGFVAQNYSKGLTSGLAGNGLQRSPAKYRVGVKVN